MIELLLQAESALSAGLLDRAEALYRQIVSADPHNAIAVVGLARVALERSDEVGALTFARRALAIDPENVAGQRMVERLEEVLRNRGVSRAPTVASAADAGSAERPRGMSDAANPADLDRPAAEPNRRSYLDRLLRRGPGGR